MVNIFLNACEITSNRNVINNYNNGLKIKRTFERKCFFKR